MERGSCVDLPSCSVSAVAVDDVQPQNLTCLKVVGDVLRAFCLHERASNKNRRASVVGGWTCVMWGEDGRGKKDEGERKESERF